MFTKYSKDISIYAFKPLKGLKKLSQTSLASIFELQNVLDFEFNISRFIYLFLSISDQRQIWS